MDDKIELIRAFVTDASLVARRENEQKTNKVNNILFADNDYWEKRWKEFGKYNSHTNPYYQTRSK